MVVAMAPVFSRESDLLVSLFLFPFCLSLSSLSSTLPLLSAARSRSELLALAKAHRLLRNKQRERK